MPLVHETELSVTQIKVTNPYARTVAYGEVFFVNGFVGVCKEIDGIAQSATGYMDINAEKLFQTDQVDTGNLPAVGDKVYLLEGAGAAGALRDTAGTGTVYFGVCTAVGVTASSEYVEVKPGYQSGSLVIA